MVGTDRDDELARTATAPGSPATQLAAPADPVGSTLGRYRLERELGSGGMGVVHAAFDPDLERRVALKVLREAAGSPEARRRLLNEARAMARLQHPNVVTVHEVASANGRDYVAMEMIEGQTLAEWMRVERRPEHEIIAAFIAAGRGLAAAHAEGIVHRDFKPHNVLRHRNGRIAVTDFGLARDAEALVPREPIDPLAETRELPAPAGTAVSTSTPSSPIGGDTVTGSVLGTPAYMAPEQWSGGAVTPATDQFGFCVALWEALAGERPFKGPTVERLREEVANGPARLDISKIPRRLRAALLRGLDPDPAKRWPSMDALLAAMTDAQNRSKAMYVVTGSAIVAGVAVLAAIKLAGGSEPVAAAPACRAPLRTVDQVWPAGSADKLAAGGQAIAARMLDADARAWTAARDKACAVDVERREPQLACLDGVLARFDVVARGVDALASPVAPGRLVGAVQPPAGSRHEVDVGSFLVDPAVCLDTPPSLATTSTPQMRATMQAVLLQAALPGRPAAAAAKDAIAAASGDPCASVYARFLAIQASSVEEREQHLVQAAEESERCRDERVRADAALMNAQLALESSLLGTAITSKVKLAELAAQRVRQHDVLGMLEQMRGEIASRAEQLDEAIARGETAAQHYYKRGRIAAEVETRIEVLERKQVRATAQDLANMADAYAALEAYALEHLGAGHDAVRSVQRNAADWQYRTGDFAGAAKRFEAVYKPAPNDPARRVRGRVVDAKGAPVAGARVAAGKRLGGTAAAAALPWHDSVRFATTGADGTFEIPDAVEFGTIVAEAGALRSPPALIADDITLALAPTSTVRGRVDLHGEPYQLVTVVAVDPDKPDMRYGWPSPVAPDGSFELGGVPRKRLKVFAAISRTTTRQAGFVEVDVKGPRVDGVKLEVMKSQRTIHILVRSTVGVAIGNAAVLVAPGKVPSMSARQMRQTLSGINEKAARQIEGERAPAPVVKLARPGDLFATMSEVPEGPASACAIALPQDLADPQLGKKIDANLDKLKIECTPIPDGAEAVVLEVPPFPRLD